ncbi:MAG: hypothetical protein CMJ18_19035 [Phycisphaeraceae bacterium]|nr:hypothetical protein [Phycisphaeraceae bacterium]
MPSRPGSATLTRSGTDAASRRGRHPNLTASAQPIEYEHEDEDDRGRARVPNRGSASCSSIPIRSG